MQKVTIDTNCLIDLEENRTSAESVRRLHLLHCQSKISLRVTAVSAAERKKDGSFAANFEEFMQKLVAVNMGNIVILKPIFYWGLSFWGHASWGGGELSKLERQIHKVLFPGIEFEFGDFCSTSGVDNKLESPECAKWRNAKCDVLIMWAHVYHGGDIFVSNDLNFFKKSKKKKLEQMGAGRILTPSEATKELQG